MYHVSYEGEVEFVANDKKKGGELEAAQRESKHIAQERELSVGYDRKKYAKEVHQRYLPLYGNEAKARQQAFTEQQLLKETEKVAVENRKMANQLAAAEKAKGEDICTYMYIYMYINIYIYIYTYIYIYAYIYILYIYMYIYLCTDVYTHTVCTHMY
jgi:hypothetical protein